MTGPTDPFEALREPVVPVSPPPAFAARLRHDLVQDVFSGGTVPNQSPTRSAAAEPVLSPYIVVADARAALAWYAEVFGATARGEVVENADGTIGHAEVALGAAVLMLAEPSALYPQVPVGAPVAAAAHSHTLHLRVADVDGVVAVARRRAAAVEREPGEQPYGRAAVLVDPFGHRWMLLNEPEPEPAPESGRQGDIAHVTMVAADTDRARVFYEAVLGLPFTPGGTPGAWGADTAPPFGVWSPPGEPPQVQLCFRVVDLDAALTRVRAAGGRAEEAEHKPYGLLAECVDDQGARFQLWQPVD